jgi:hypothetical protein
MKFLITLAIATMSSYVTSLNTAKMTELRRQYMDYLTIFEKEESGDSFNVFVERLGLVESFNRDETRCRWYLTQYSDTEELDKEIFTKRCRSNNKNF